MRRHWSVRAGIVLGVAPIVAAVMLLIVPGAAAAPLTPDRANSADAVTLSMNNGASFTYAGTPTPQFAATVVLATKPTANYPMFLSVQLDGTGAKFGDIPYSESSDQLTYYYHINTQWSSILPGNHTAVASFTNPSTSVTTQSTAVSFTVNKGMPSLQCMIMNLNQVVSAGYTLNIQMTNQSGSGISVDWQNGTYTIKFIGSSTVTRSNLAPDSNDMVAVQAPTQYGRYTEVDCIFNGTSLFAPATTNAAGQPVLVSQEQKLGTVQLYTNPTTLASNQSADMYVVFHAAPGGPTPTGYFNIDLGSYYSTSLTIGSDGTQLVHVDQVPNLNGVSQISISYHGDPYYNWAVVNFPMTNPPIPSGGNGGNGGSEGGPSSTPSPTPKSTPTALASSSSVATPTVATPDKPLLASTHVSQGGGMPWWIALLVLLLLAGGAVGTVFAMRRAKATSGAAATPESTLPPASTLQPEQTDPSDRDTELD